MDVQVALGTNFIDAVLAEVHLLNNFTRESGLGKFIALHVIVVEMLPLKFTIKSAKRLYIDKKCKLICSRVNETLNIAGGSLNQFEGRVGRKINCPLIND